MSSDVVAGQVIDRARRPPQWLKRAQLIAAIAMVICTALWFAARHALVTRTEWEDHLKRSYQFEGAVDMSLRDIRSMLNYQTGILDEVRERSARIEGRLHKEKR